MSRKTFFHTLLLFAASIFLISCATIVGGGRTQQMTFTSEPEGATVTVGGRILGKTPLTVQLDRERGKELTFEKEGYKPIKMELTSTINPWFWGNIIIGGLLGSTTDGLTGAVHEYSPSQYFINMTRIGSNAMSSKPSRGDVMSYIIGNYGRISIELNSVEGEYVNALYALLEIPVEKRADAYKKIRGMSNKNENILKFAQAVAEDYYSAKR